MNGSIKGYMGEGPEKKRTTSIDRLCLNLPSDDHINQRDSWKVCRATKKKKKMMMVREPPRMEVSKVFVEESSVHLPAEVCWAEGLPVERWKVSVVSREISANAAMKMKGEQGMMKQQAEMQEMQRGGVCLFLEAAFVGWAVSGEAVCVEDGNLAPRFVLSFDPEEDPAAKLFYSASDPFPVHSLRLLPPLPFGVRLLLRPCHCLRLNGTGHEDPLRSIP